jgi:hypothetical protein
VFEDRFDVDPRRTGHQANQQASEAEPVRYLRAVAAEGLAGAAMTNQFLLEESPWLPLALLVVAAVIAWARRSSNSILVDMLRR